MGNWKSFGGAARNEIWNRTELPRMFWVHIKQRTEGKHSGNVDTQGYTENRWLKCLPGQGQHKSNTEKQKRQTQRQTTKMTDSGNRKRSRQRWQFWRQTFSYGKTNSRHDVDIPYMTLCKIAICHTFFMNRAEHALGGRIELLLFLAAYISSDIYKRNVNCVVIKKAIF